MSEEELEKNIYSIKIENKTFYFGDVCPKIEPIFFPIEEEEKGDSDDTAQSS